MQLNDRTLHRLAAVSCSIVLPLGAATSCKRDEGSSGVTAISAQASASAAPGASGTRPGPGHRKKAGDLKPPPALPPASAAEGPMGIRYQMLSQGPEPKNLAELKSERDSIVITAELSIWKPDGTLAYTSYKESTPRSISVSDVSERLRGLLLTVMPGGVARFWMPEQARGGWAPVEWPPGDLIFDLEVLSMAVQRPVITPATPRARRPPPTPGPPANATKVSGGLSFVLLRDVPGVRAPAPDDQIQLSWDAWVVEGGQLRRAVKSQIATFTLKGAPAGFREIAPVMTVGDEVRVWIPAGQAPTLVPEAAQQPLIVDARLNQLH